MSDLGTLLEREMQSFHTDYGIGAIVRKRDRRRRNRRVGNILVALLLAVVALVALSRVFRFDRSVPASNPPTGTLVYSRQVAGGAGGIDVDFTSSVDGSNETRLLADTGDVLWVSPDGNRVLFGDFHKGLPWITPGVVRLDGSDRAAIPVDPRLSGLMPTAWSPDGRRFAASGLATSSSSPLRGVYTAGVPDGSDLTQVTVTPDGQHDTPIAFSPDGSRILFIRRIQPLTVGANHQLYVVNVDGTELVKLNPAGTYVRTHHEPFELTGPGGADGDDESWSPDGSMVAFVGVQGGMRRAVIVAGADGTGARRITPWGDIRSAQWSPNGQWIAFSRQGDSGRWDLFVIHSDGSGLRQITFATDGLSSFGPVWSPDGARLLFARNADGSELDSNLWMVKVDGTELTQVTHQLGQYWTYAWSPVELGS